MRETEKLLELHIQEDRIALAAINDSLKSLGDKLDAQALAQARLETKVEIKSKLNGAVWGVIAGASSSLVTALIVWAITKQGT